MEILDTAPDPAFDRLTKLAAEIFSTPISVVSFIADSRQWFKSRHGIEVTETPREIAFCAHTILEQDPMIVLDATQDIRFSANPFVAGPAGLRFYAGAPLTTRDGHNVGSLCVLDTKPRASFSDKEQEMLQGLADLAVQALYDHRLNLDLLSSAAKSRGRLDLVARATLDGIWDWDMVRNSAYYSPRWLRILGLQQANEDAGLAHWLDRIHPEDRARVDDELEAHLADRTLRFKSEHRVRHGDGSWRWIVVRGLVQRRKTGQPVRMVGSVMDITKEKTCDSLTGLPNRLLLEDRLAYLIQRSELEQTWNFAVYFLDVDRFRQINDRFGQTVGDSALQMIAKRLQSVVGSSRSSPDSMLARFSGDQFVLALDRVANRAQAEAVAARLHAAFNDPIVCEGEETSTAVSIGIALADSTCVTPEILLQNADLALTRSKVVGRGTSTVFDPSMQQEWLARLELEADLRHAVSKNQMRVLYQPQIELRTGRLIGCEALVRWQHPRQGLLTPDKFITIAEELGLIGAIDLWVMETACNQLREWKTLAPGAEMSVSVNISAHHLTELGLKDAVESTLARCGLPPSSLCLELTESVMMENADEGAQLMQELRSIGVGLHMDDFGSGYSSFKQLSDLPFDTLKLDRSLVKNIASDHQARSVVATIVKLAQTLGLKVIGEGIEDQPQSDLLSSMSCDIGQGYHFARPLNAADFQQKFLSPQAVPPPAKRNDSLTNARKSGTDCGPAFPTLLEDLKLSRRIFSSVCNGITIADATVPGLPLVYVNSAFEKMTGYRAAEVLGRNCKFLQGDVRGQPGLDDLRTAIEARKDVRTILQNYRKDGTAFWNELYMSPVFDADGAVTHFIGIQNDITAQMESTRKLDHLAHHDALTGLANRGLLIEQLKQAIARCHRSSGTFAVLFFDLDNFKQVNDVLGHDAGDIVLQAVAQRLRSQVRAEETVARLGGDEFVVVLEDFTDARKPPAIVPRIVASLAQPVDILSHRIHPVASVGIACFPHDGKTPEALLKVADLNMYNAKHNARSADQSSPGSTQMELSVERAKA